MNLFNLFSNLYLFLVAFVITVGFMMVILFVSLFNRDEEEKNIESKMIAPEELEQLRK